MRGDEKRDAEQGEEKLTCQLHGEIDHRRAYGRAQRHTVERELARRDGLAQRRHHGEEIGGAVAQPAHP